MADDPSTRLRAGFAQRVALLLRVLTHVGEADDAAVLRAVALDAVDDRSIRNVVRRHLDSAA